MSNDMFDGIGPDLYNYYNRVDQATAAQYRAATVKASSAEANNTLSFEDMLLLMVTQLQNQTIDNTADTNDMMNQIIQMTVMQAITEMSTQVQDLTEANILTYSASLVGQTVTVPIYDNYGEIVGEKADVVTATGTYNGQRVIFMGDEYYPLNQIMAVGVLPERKSEAADQEQDAGAGSVPPVTGTDKTDQNEGGTDAAEETVDKALG